MSNSLLNLPCNIILAEDDDDDCYLFEHALEQLNLGVTLTSVHNGEQLMQLLESRSCPLPQVLFLDINMPRKNGIECLKEIKSNDRLKGLPVAILSTSYSPEVISRLYQFGAFCYMNKPLMVSQLMSLIHQVLLLTVQQKAVLLSREEFLLLPEYITHENK